MRPAPRTALISVIIPSYNTSAYIREAIDSVLAQDCPDLDLIVVDDGSTDGTVDVVRSYGERLRLLTQRNEGAAAARNAGLAAASGEYIAFLDSDDVWLPGKLAAQIRHLEANPQVGIVYSRWKTWKPESDGTFPSALSVAMPGETVRTDEAPGVVPERSGWLYNRLLFSSLLHTITVVARRSLVEAVGPFDTELKRGQDYDYWIRASRVSEIHQLDRVMALYRLHGEGCIKRWPEINFELVVIEKALARWGLEGPTGERTPPARIRKRLSDACFSFGYHHYWEGDPRIALRSFAQSVGRRPTRLASWRYMAMSAFKAVGR